MDKFKYLGFINAKYAAMEAKIKRLRQTRTFTSLTPPLRQALYKQHKTRIFQHFCMQQMTWEPTIDLLTRDISKIIATKMDYWIWTHPQGRVTNEEIIQGTWEWEKTHWTLLKSNAYYGMGT